LDTFRTVFSSSSNFFGSIPAGTPSIITLKLFFTTFTVVTRTRIEKMKVQIGSAICHKWLPLMSLCHQMSAPAIATATL
jgi:hypothetical protein